MLPRVSNYTYLGIGLGRAYPKGKKVNQLYSVISNRDINLTVLQSSKTCNEAVWGDMGLETLKSRRDRGSGRRFVDCRIAGTPSSCLVKSGK